MSDDKNSGILSGSPECFVGTDVLDSSSILRLLLDFSTGLAVPRLLWAITLAKRKPGGCGISLAEPYLSTKVSLYCDDQRALVKAIHTVAVWRSDRGNL